MKPLLTLKTAVIQPQAQLRSQPQRQPQPQPRPLPYPGTRAVELARQWIGTPWHHQGRIKKVGADCIGLIIGVVTEMGYPVKDVTRYPRKSNGVLEAGLKAHCFEVTGIQDRFQSRLPVLDGDIGLFTIGADWLHVGFLTTGGESLIHIHQSIGKCLEHPFDYRWKKRLNSIFRWPF